ncbi:hypothetical protein GOP47_0001730 [Adiantum capillus-veneris]|uniref:EF-hand domain-containing protein n=1 Tax=Adiantum capillus-veneris TaxID=13818 RepID=A0A9D4VAM2_ADICA|nr:hypothetical protein GOP47_0001730 [Adiantum capillus-veneris]
MAQEEDLRIFFQAVDTDNSGSINETELQEALSAGNLRFNRSVIAQMIKMYDRDQSGSMSYEEFVSLHKFLSVVQNSYAKYARDRNFLELNDVYLALQETGYSLDQPAFYTACQSFDPNKLGKFRLDDYISLCIFLQSARNLFGAFDTKREGRVALDFNQFVYCAANLRL